MNTYYVDSFFYDNQSKLKVKFLTIIGLKYIFLNSNIILFVALTYTTIGGLYRFGTPTNEPKQVIVGAYRNTIADVESWNVLCNSIAKSQMIKKYSFR